MVSIYLPFSIILASLTSAYCIIQGKVVSAEYQAQHFYFAIAITLRGKVNCGGVLLSLDWTLTSCSCLGNFHSETNSTFEYHDLNSIVLIGGSNYLFVDSKNLRFIQLQIPVNRVRHPECNSKTWSWKSDYGAYQSNPFVMSRSLRPAIIVPTQLLQEMTLMWVSLETPCVTIGWGATTINFTDNYVETSSEMKMADVFLMDWGPCGLALCSSPLRVCDEKIYGLGKLCAGPINGSDSCDKDEGGALMCGNNFIVGLNSKGISCGEYHKPRVYSSIIDGMSWFESIRDSGSPKKLQQPQLLCALNVMVFICFMGSNKFYW